jgi:hypothetical protein
MHGPDFEIKFPPNAGILERLDLDGSILNKRDKSGRSAFDFARQRTDMRSVMQRIQQHPYFVNDRDHLHTIDQVQHDHNKWVEGNLAGKKLLVNLD